MEEENKTEEEIKHKKNNQINFFAETNFRNQRVKFGIKKDDRRRHVYLIGKTGMGKSTAMENMIIQDIANGEGVALVDPHGDFAEKIINFIPNERINDVIYLDPSDIQYPIAFNVMEAVSQEHKHLVASGLIGVFKKLWADSWGPRLEYLLRNAILALLDYPGSTLLGVMRILVDKTYRNKVITKIKDPVVKAFWVEEYSKYPQQFQVEAIAPIQNKVGAFLSTAMIRNVIGQVKSTIDIRQIMDEQKILIMNLSKGRIGEDSSAMLGAMMITKIQLAAMSRIDTLEDQRKDFYLYVDEFQNFATESFANILSEARKYRLNLIIGHQYVEQLDELVRAAVFGNVGTLMCFRVGAADAEFLATEFAPYFIEEDLVNLTKYDVYMKLMIDGVSSNPFSATTLPPIGGNYSTNNKEKVIKVSRERYAKPREIVEDKISRWSGVNDEDEENNDLNEKNQKFSKKVEKADIGNAKIKPQLKKNLFDTSKKDKPAQKPKFTATCYECGKSTEINFKPDGVRPIYCNICFQKIKNKIIEGNNDGGIEVKETNIENQSEISLQEALSRGPLPFEEKKSKEYLLNLNKQPQPQKKPSIYELIEQKKQNSKNDFNKQVKTVKPGEVIKF